jgi:hypothetical protein
VRTSEKTLSPNIAARRRLVIRIALVSALGALIACAVRYAVRQRHESPPVALAIPLDPETRPATRPATQRTLSNRIDATSCDARRGGRDAGTHMGYLSRDTWLQYKAVDFGPGATLFTACVGVSDRMAGNTIEVRLREPTGPIVAALLVETTGGWGRYLCQVAPVAEVRGVHDVYLTFSGGDSVADLAWFKFTRSPVPAMEVVIAACAYDALQGVTDAGTHLRQIDTGDWVRYGGLDFGPGTKTFALELVAPVGNSARAIELRLDAPDGAIVAKLPVQSTGGSRAPSWRSVEMPSPLSGVHDVYLTFAGGTGVAEIHAIRFSK